MNEQELIEKLIDTCYMTYEQVQGLDIDELQDTYLIYANEDLQVQWQEAISYHGFIGSFNEYLQGLFDSERDFSKLIYEYCN